MGDVDLESADILTAQARQTFVSDDRVEQLRAYDILDTPPEETFDRLARLTARSLGCPIAMISLVDDDSQWCKASVGLNRQQSGRQQSFCFRAMALGKDVLSFDPHEHPDFSDLVARADLADIHFYAGAALRSPGGARVGMLAVADRQKRQLSEDEQQVLLDCAHAVVDALELRLALRMIADSEGRSRAIFDTAVDPIITISDRGLIQTVNPATIRMFGYRQDELVGQNVSMLMPAAHAPRHDGYLEAYRKTQQPQVIGKGRQVPARRKDGSQFSAELSVSEGFNGEERFFTGILRDVSARVEAEETLRENVRLLELAEKAATLGHWRLDVSSGKIEWSDEVYRIFGLSPETYAPVGKAVYEAFHPADQDRVRHAVAASVHEGRDLDVEARILRLGDGLRTVQIKAQALRGAENVTIGLFGIIQDISRLKKAEQLAQVSQSRLAMAIDNISDGILILDDEDRMVLWNEKLLELYPRMRALTREGILFEDAIRAGALSGQYKAAIGRVDEWVAERMARHRQPEELYEERMSDGRWVRVAERLMPNGWRVGIRTDITEVRTAEEVAQAANRAKSEFLSNMSHELRTPLNAILGFAQLLQTSRLEPLTEKQDSYVDHILSGGRHLLDLINEILDLARIEAGGMTLSIESIAPRDVIDECLEMVSTIPNHHAVTVVDETAAELPVLKADFTRLKQILLNLLSNALKYNVKGGSVRLTSMVVDQSLRLAVIDSGPGMTSLQLSHLFEPFNRLGAEATDIEGTGIGLIITKTLIAQMGGSIGVESTVGKGSTFWIDVPLAAASAVPASSSGNAVTEDAKLSPYHRRHVVLYVEDNPANVRLVEEVIDQLGGIELITALTGEAGLEAAHRQRPDAILMDVNLPDISGIDVVRRLRQDQALSSSKIIVLSANAMSDAILAASQAGADVYLTKPVVVKDLTAALVEALERRRKEQ